MISYTDRFKITPLSMFEYLDRHVSGQKEAKTALSNVCYNGFLKSLSYKLYGKDKLNKFPVLFIGPTGCGKTYLIDTVSSFLTAPVYTVDASTICATGYSSNGGVNIKGVIEEYVGKCCGMALEFCENAHIDHGVSIYDLDTEFDSILNTFIMNGLLVFDEFDKLSELNDGSSQRKYNAQVQDNFLRVIENEEFEVDLKHISTFPAHKSFTIKSSMIPMIFIGAFSYLRKDKEAKESKRSLGFVGRETEKKSQITKKDLSENGFKEELLGRIGAIVTLDFLSEGDLKNILLNVENSIISQYRIIYGLHNKKLMFDDSVVEAAITEAKKTGLGARELKSFLTQQFQDLLFNLPETEVESDEPEIVTVFFRDGKLVEETERVKLNEK